MAIGWPRFATDIGPEKRGGQRYDRSDSGPPVQGLSACGGKSCRPGEKAAKEC